MTFNATFLISAISFVIFVLIMNQIFYKPLEKIVKERNKIIEDNTDVAKENNAKAEKLLAEREKEIQKANFECKTILDIKANEAKENKNKMVLDAQRKAADDVVLNQKDLETAFSETKQNLKSDVSNLANEISKRLFGEKVGLKDHSEQMINEVMK